MVLECNLFLDATVHVNIELDYKAWREMPCKFQIKISSWRFVHYVANNFDIKKPEF